MKVIRTTLLLLCGFVVLQAVLFGLLVAGAAVPDRAVATQLVSDLAESRYGPPGAIDRMGGTADTFTECVVAGTGLGRPDLGVVDRAALMPRLASCNGGDVQIRAVVSGEEIDGLGYYFRYWAGYTVVTKPAIAWWGLGGLRVLVGAILVAALLGLVWAVSRTVSALAAAALVAPLVVASNVMSTPSTSLSQALSIATYLGCAAGTALAASRSMSWGLLSVGVSAALFCFMDLLTTPAAAWMLSVAVAAGVTWVRTKGLKDTSFSMVVAGALWPLAFAATWASRWIIAVPAAGAGVVRRDVVDKMLFRSSGAAEGVRPSLGVPTSVNVRYWFEHVPTARVAIAAVALLVLVMMTVMVRRALRGGPDGFRPLVAAGVIGLPAGIAVVWYEVLSNHSQIHEFFTYRNLPVALGVVGFAVVAAAERRSSVAAAPEAESATERPVFAQAPRNDSRDEGTRTPV
ncbi:hypothetical protein GCM10023168_04220 [Fodinibacter luteus]|uniref:Glycosyltransferase RgtA/B/C/D-like domain-containing protein n=1 Tax=Fodinibacter luteus TaxID=552064 RepID=A0ABP8JZH1_9MICO